MGLHEIFCKRSVAERSKVELNEVEESVVKLKKVERSGAEVLFTRHFMSSREELK